MARRSPNLISSVAAEDKNITGMRIALQCVLVLQSETVHVAPHVGAPDGKPDRAHSPVSGSSALLPRTFGTTQTIKDASERKIVEVGTDADTICASNFDLDDIIAVARCR